MSEGACSCLLSYRQPYTDSNAGVYENSGIAVRIPPERVYEISRNQPHLEH